MKNYILLLIATALFACGCGSKKDKVNSWSQEDRDSYINQCESMGIMFSGVGDAWKDYCICTLGVAQQKWSNLEEADKASMNLTMKENEELYRGCVKQHLE